MRAANLEFLENLLGRVVEMSAEKEFDAILAMFEPEVREIARATRKQIMDQKLMFS